MSQAAAGDRRASENPLHPHIVPFSRQALFGRGAEIAAIVHLLSSGRSLLTITGPGGVGKTRLALAVLAEVDRAGQYPNPGVFVTLAPVASDSLVISTIGRALGVLAHAEDEPVDRLIEALQGKKLLLVLDNLEHVLGASVEIARLLAGCPDLTILATSRRALRLSAEQEFPLAPLQIASAFGENALADIASSPAVALFLARATAANASFAFTEANAADILQICRRLDGLPLAIELAAARVKLMSPKALLSRLSGRLQLLTSGPRDVPQRQQTLRDAIAWSYDLLTPEEQTLFRHFAVFAGGASLVAIEAVAREAPALATFDALDLTASLVDHSLLVQENVLDGEPRFRMLETLREFALDQLATAGEAERARDAHAAFFVEIAERAARIEYGPEEAQSLRNLVPDLDNFRGALTWLLDDRGIDSGRARLGLRLAGSMVRFWDLHGYLQEETDWLNRALTAVPEEASVARRNALTALGVNAWFSGDIDLADQLQARALALGRELGDKKAIIESLWFTALVSAEQQELVRLEELAAEADPLLDHIGIVLWRSVPDTIRALAAMGRGEWDLARRHLRLGLDYHKANGFHWPHAWVQGVLAETEALAANHGESLRLFQQTLVEFHGHGDIYATLDCLAAIARHASTYGDAVTGARLTGTIAARRAVVGNRVTWPAVKEEHAVSAARASLGQTRFEAEFAIGRGWPLEQAVENALAVQPGAVVAISEAPADADPFGLSPREREVLRLLVEGRSNEQIGATLFISPRTAGTHVANILGKLGVHSRAAAVGLALSQKLV